MVRAALSLLLLLACSLGAQAGDFLVSGRFLYEDKAWNEDGWTGQDPLLPVRLADVTIFDLDSGRVLGRGHTDGLGEFVISARSKHTVGRLAARVRAETRSQAKASKPFPRLKVMSPSKEVYAAWSDELFDHPPTQAVDLGTTTILKVLSGAHEGNPFNILDMGVHAFELLTSSGPGVKKRGRSLRLTWPNITGSFALGRRAWISRSDGYDDPVILHEIGHLVHNLYSDSDNPGGFHSFGDSNQDPRLSFGEGWATAFSGLVLEHAGSIAHYVDSKGQEQVGAAQLRLSLETTAPYFGSVLGATDEVAVACVLFDMLDGVSSEQADSGDDDDLQPGVMVADSTPWGAFWDVFTGPVKRASNSTLNSVWDGWVKLNGDGAELEPVEEIFADRAIVFANDAFEPNQRRKQAKPIEISGAGEWLEDLTLYYREAGSKRSGARDRDWFVVELQQGWRVDVETRYPAGAYDATSQADTWISLHRPSGRRVARTDNGGAGRNAALHGVLIDESGPWTIQVRTRNRVHRYGRYELRVQLGED